MKLSVVVPAHNEEENIVEVISSIEDSLTGIEHELVVVNDHSQDKTAELTAGLAARYNNVRPVENRNACGFANALKTGFAAADGEAVIPVMADLCDDLSTIKKMLEKMDEGYDIVCGSRYIEGGTRLGGSKLKGFLSSLAGHSLYWLLGIPTHDIANAFKIYKRRVLDAINIEASGFEISMEIPLKAFYLGFKITELPTVWRERQKGKSSFKMFKLLPRYLNFYLRAILKRFTR